MRLCAVQNMSIPGHAKQAGGSPPRRAGAPCRQITMGDSADAADRRSPKAARSSYTRMTVPSRNGSWYAGETRAFADESSRYGQLDAGVWPPRAYPCTFCEREFRSAQALGGHMNVHRRDRARLRKDSPSPPSPTFGSAVAVPRSESLIHIQNFSAALSAQYSSDSLAPPHSPAIPFLKFRKFPPYSSLPLSYPSTAAASLPSCLQQLASEAAASLSEYPPQQYRCKFSDLPTLVPSLNGNRASFGRHSSEGGAVVMEKSPQIVYISSSLPSPPSSKASSYAPLASIRDGAKRRWNNPLINPDEKSSWSENDRNQLLSHIITDSDALKEVLYSLDARPVLTKTASRTACMLRRIDAYESACGSGSGGNVDLELRLGRPPT